MLPAGLVGITFVSCAEERSGGRPAEGEAEFRSLLYVLYVGTSQDTNAMHALLGPGQRAQSKACSLWLSAPSF
jgi:hypothetical protein